MMEPQTFVLLIVRAGHGGAQIEIMSGRQPDE
jgi:hypothetical protein